MKPFFFSFLVATSLTSSAYFDNIHEKAFNGFEQKFKSGPEAHKTLSQGNVIVGKNNTVNGIYNMVKGKNNFVLGSINQIEGDSNTNLGSYNGIIGSNNWIVGSGHKIKANGVRMFGPNTSPQFRVS